MICEIIFGNEQPQTNGDVYWFDESEITETELIMEIRDLKPYYTKVVLPKKWPPQFIKTNIDREVE